MKTKLFLALCIAALTISSVEAFDWQSYLFMIATPKLIPTYKLLDQLIMTFFKPIIWTVLYQWSSPLICTQLLPIIFGLTGQTSSLSQENQIAICNQGIEVWVNNYFTQGTQAWPIDTTWAGTPLN